MSYREVEVSELALKEATALGVVGEGAVNQLKNWARLAAPVTHEAGQWRYEDYILFIDEGVLEGVSAFY